jgi:hypothetical protein
MAKMKEADEKKQMAFRVPRSVRIALRRRAADEDRSIEGVVADAFLAYLATPLPRAQRSA